MIQEDIKLTNAVDFISTLDEVDVLIRAADSHEEHETEYAAFNKSALLLLTGKFENFAESIAEDYVAYVNSLQPSCNLIPNALRLQHTFKMLAKIELYRQKQKQDEAISALATLGNLWISDSSSISLDIDCKFSYGKHGEAELRKLFSTIGIDDVFEVIEVVKYQEILLEVENDRVKIDFKGTFNSITGMRNNILHQDASPNLTTRMIRGYKQEVQQFAQELEKYLNNELCQMANACIKVEDDIGDVLV